ncbi:hypothetical protein F8M41_017189 [Gigaspora margarita]|uniref:Uncharacterized protein n=1 Tax=Gigaspora margarita TaxID=4874 RepID=A0A8H4B324_GIGMA|nr:hypothetical protein F8M41_017189 [Gigaspora margarita]
MVSFQQKMYCWLLEKFCQIEETDDDGNTYSILKITLTDAVPLNIDPIDLPKFSLLINMIAIALENAENNQTDIIIPIETKDYMDQDNVIQTFKSYHLTNAQHLTCVTLTVKRGSVMFISAPTNKSDTVENVTRTIATRVKYDGRCKKAEPYSKTKNQPKIADLAKNALN